MQPPPVEFSVHIDSDGNATVKFGDETPLTKPDNLLDRPMNVEPYDNLVWFEALAVMFFRAKDGTLKGCVKRPNCDYLW